MISHEVKTVKNADWQGKNKKACAELCACLFADVYVKRDFVYLVGFLFLRASQVMVNVVKALAKAAPIIRVCTVRRCVVVKGSSLVSTICSINGLRSLSISILEFTSAVAI
jgi:hypothetical protein